MRMDEIYFYGGGEITGLGGSSAGCGSRATLGSVSATGTGGTGAKERVELYG